MSTKAVIVLALVLLLVAGLFVGKASAHGETKWYRLAHCESTHRWHINTGNGYYGGLQFSKSTWDAYRRGITRTRWPHNARPRIQIKVARRVLDGQGWGAWANCADYARWG